MHGLKGFVSFVGLWFFVSISPATAEEPSDTSLDDVADIEDLDLAELLGVVSTASRRDESASKAPAAVTVLDAEAIRLSGARTIPELLQRVPGVQLTRVAPGNTIVSLRGAGGLIGNNVLITIDGVSMKRLLDAGVDWSLVPVQVDEIERLEVARGPVSPIYGADGFTGVIAITTKSAAEDRVEGTGRLASGVDLNGDTAGEVAAAAAGSSEALSWRLGAHSVRDDLYTDSALPGRESVGANAMLRWQSSETLSLTAQTQAGQGTVASLDPLLSFGGEHTTQRALGGLKLSWTNPYDWLRSVDLSAGARWETIDGKTLAASNYRTTYDGFEGYAGESALDVNLQPLEDLAVGLGVDAGLNRYDAPFIEDVDAARDWFRLGVYANIAYELFELVTISGAIRDDFATGIEEDQLSFRAALVLHLESLSIRLSIGRAFRSPTIMELGARFVDPDTGTFLLQGTHGLVPAHTGSGELGAIWAITRGLTLRPSVYFQKFEDAILEDFTFATKLRYGNATEQATMFGGELEIEWTVNEALSLATSASLLLWPDGGNPEGSLVGVEGESSQVTAWAGAWGTCLEGELRGSLGLRFDSARDYDRTVAIPSAHVVHHVEPSVRATAFIEYALDDEVPYWLWARLDSTLPDGLVSSPLPGAMAAGSSAMVGLRLTR